MKKIDWLIFVLFFIISVFILKDLFKAGFYTSHDGPNQIVRFYYFDKIIREGQIPPRFVGGLLNGFGYPLFEFSYHIPWIIAEFFHLASFSIIDSVKLTFFSGFFLSGLTMYLYQKEMVGRFAAFIGAFLYLFAPYRFLNIFVRAAIGDATIFIFAPLVFLSLYIFHTRKNISFVWITIGALGIAGMLLSHAMVFFLLSLGVAVYVIFWLLVGKYKKEFLLRSAITASLGIGLTGYYFIPSFAERGLTQFSDVVKMFFLNSTFVDFHKLIYSSWGYGAFNAEHGAMSIQLGITQWLIVILSCLTLFYRFAHPKDDGKKDMNVTIVCFLLIFLMSILLMLPLSRPIWPVLNIIAAVDFTWRILAVTVFATSVLAGLLINHTPHKYIIGFLIILLALYSNRNHIHINQSLSWPVELYLKLEKTTNTFDEYTPRWVKNDTVAKPRAKVELIDTKGITQIQTLRSNLIEGSAQARDDGKLRINTIYYPGWNVYLNGKKVPIAYKDTGVMETPLKKGNSQIIAKFEETPLRLVSDALTFIAFVASISFLVHSKRKIHI